MRVRSFRAPKMAEAMAALRAELGDEAIILGTRRSGGGVEITAALEPEEPVIIPPAAVAPAITGPLCFHNAPAPLAERLQGRPLDAALGEVFTFAPLPAGRTRPLLLAGPPGAGKTLTCAKLAVRHVMGGTTPLVVTTDGKRAGAAEQLAAFTRLLGLTLAVAPSPATLAKALARRAEGQPALIDTAGCDPFDPTQAVAFRELALRAEADIALVLPAGMDAAESADLARAFGALGASHLIATRLDTARRLGSVLAAAEAGPLALAEAGIGPGVADSLEPLSPAMLAARIAAGPRRPAPAQEFS